MNSKPKGKLFYNLKSIIFEILLIEHSIRNTLGYFDWYSLVDDNLYLGAIPLYPQHLDNITKKLNIDVICSIVQSFELSTNTIVGRPIEPKLWSDLNIQQYIIDSPDFVSPSFEKLDAGAAFINLHLSQGKRVYCHCKSGKGRSASIIMAYFIKYKQLDVYTAYSDLKKKRKYIFNMHSHQMRNMIQYYSYIKASNNLKY